MKNNISTYRFIFFCVLLLLPLSTIAQNNKHPFKGHFVEETEHIDLYLDLYEPSLTIPEMDFLGPVHGYIKGNIYGIWMLTSHDVTGEIAKLRFSNDLGADSQSIELTLVNDSILDYRTIGGNNIKKIYKRKLVKIPNKLRFVLQGK